MSDYQCLAGIVVALVFGFVVGRQMSCHESYKKGKQEAEIKYLKKIADIEAEQFKKPMGPHGVDIK